MSTTYTTNYHLGKQTDTSDTFDMSVITDNMDIIDTQMKSNENNILSLQAQINDYSDVMPNVKAVLKGNMFDITTATDGYYINPNTGGTNTNASYTASGFIEVTPSTNLELKFFNNLYGAYYTESKTYISESGILYQNINDNYTAIEQVPANAHYIRVSVATNTVNSLSVKAKEYLKNYFVHRDQVDGLGIETRTTVYTVGASGYDYTTLKKAFAACVDGSPSNKYIVEFHGNGTEYDLSSEITQEELSDPSFIGIRVPKYTCLKGIGGKNKNIIALRLANNSSAISTLNLYGSSSLDGLTIIGNKTRYTVHDDYPDAGAERTIKNCKVIAESSTYHGTWGAGSRSGNNWTFENCEFISKQSETLPFLCHNNISFAEPTIFKFKNCRFKNTASAENAYVNFRTLNNNANGIINEVYMYGCDALKVNLIEENASSYGSGILFDCSGYGNTFTSSDCTYTSTDGIDYSDRFDFI